MIDVMIIAQTCVRAVATVWTDICSVGTAWPLNRYYVDMCRLVGTVYGHNVHAVTIVCRHILLVPSSLPDKYGLTYRPITHLQL